ncbi:MAG: hypothetical protein J0H36_12120 [Hyphomicrobium denitrificans]|uniref:Uncharacterized protein n=1 Tax=Hyphomicrobium denitrificans (strain ATCC 51888 / DSM 1869 / NCIMB 11706 / TK 0415) TaxID=582899 RepID=D8JZB9_HYPDA|nr:hypothetical protein [Hyphomicrobium denitrificans]ADJ23721.1 conserved hypothetical protein [Hyphomicrobium denitrificans ATCC 51888]MBN9291824.1 hypothetical protein [Hyphomicrobium denitrificans]
MKKSLIAAAAFAALTLGGASMASAGVASSSLNGISTHNSSSAAEQVDYRRHGQYKKRGVKRHSWHKKKWVCRYRHGHRHCAWR